MKYASIINEMSIVCLHKNQPKDFFYEQYAKMYVFVNMHACQVC